MYLSKLEIFGFKSFANRTELKFSKGITGVVGPNGCGKTNIVDAIRWCLGEQKSSALRSDKMENVIFNGTKAKKPMGMSEVSMTLVNDNGALPSEYSEITITRRIFRSGESEYLLNKNVCRLKDITNLFMDTGMSTNAYSVIELKMVEIILSSRQEERRRMFEEAAGVNKYKLRRKYTLKKLEEVKSDLTRVNDIVSEVEKNVRSLERQAKRADKYNRVIEELREKELSHAERKFSLFLAQTAVYQEQKDKLTEIRKDIDSGMKEFEEAISIKKEKVNEIERVLRAKITEISKLNERIHEVQKTISVAQEREKSLDRNLERFRHELDEFYYQEDETADQAEQLKGSIAEYEQGLEQNENEVSNFKLVIEESKSAVEEKKNALKALNEEEISRYKDITEQENILKNLNHQFAALQKRIGQADSRIQKLNEDIARTSESLDKLAEQKKASEEELRLNEELLERRKTEKENLEKELSSMKEKELEEKGTLNNLRDKIDFLQQLITNLEGVSDGAKALLDAEEWAAKDKTLFADVGTADEKYRYALESSLKNVLNNLLIDNFADLKIAIDYLKGKNLGKASFFLLKNGEHKKSFVDTLRKFRLKRKSRQIEKEEGFLGWAYDYVKTENKWKSWFDQALSNTVLAGSLDSAIELSKNYHDFSFATLEGDIVYNNGVIEAGSLPNLEDTLFGRRQMLENLKEELPKFEESLKELRGKIEAAEEKLSQIDLNVISEKSKLLVNGINTLEKQISQHEYEKSKSTEEADQRRTEIKEISGEAEAISEKINITGAAVEEKKEEKHKFGAEVKEFEDELKAVEKEHEEVVSSYNRKKLELERQKGQLQTTRNNLANALASIDRIKNNITKREKDIASTEEEIVSIKNIIEDKEYEFDEVNDVKKGLQEEKDKIETNLNAIKEEYSALEVTLNKNRKERQDISDRLHEINIQVNDITHKYTTLVEHIKEEYGVDLEPKEFEDLETFDYKTVEREIHALKEQLKNLGPVNQLAYNEYEEEKKRLDFLLGQRNDLIDSEKDLLETIKEINTTAQTQFKDVFEQVRANFQQIFRTLFDPEDEADLVLEPDVDPLDAKIDITAKPKGKRPTSIELLSGGEKTLTATALLFAIYLVKPSPFCILDEVDAPLDDANVDRFTNLLREFSNNTQFIIVTHNKRTMEAAETMYGVTMQEEGISKLASVQFNEDLPIE